MIIFELIKSSNIFQDYSISNMTWDIMKRWGFLNVSPYLSILYSRLFLLCLFYEIFMKTFLQMKTETIAQHIWNPSLGPTAAFSQTRYQSCHPIYSSCTLIIKKKKKKHTHPKFSEYYRFSEHFMGKWKRGCRLFTMT